MPQADESRFLKYCLFTQAQNTMTMQQQQGCPTSQSEICCEESEQQEQHMSGYARCTIKAPALHFAELVAVAAESTGASMPSD